MDAERRLVDCLLLLALAPLVLYVAFAVAPSLGGYAVASGSMSPTIRPGSVVYVAEADAYAVGDVITFSRDGATVTHRVTDATDAGLVTAGDANPAPDPRRVRPSQIRGKVLFSLPLYGYLVRPAFPQTLSLLAVVVGGTVGVTAGARLRDRRR